MTASIDNFIHVSPVMIRFYVSSTESTPTYYVYTNGVFTFTTDSDIIDIPVGAYEKVQVDIFDDSSSTPTYYPRKAIIEWNHVTDADYYLVHKYVDAAWTQMSKINVFDSSVPRYRYETTYLDNETTTSYRITPYNSSDVAGIPKFVDVPVVSYSDPLTWSFTYSAGQIDITGA